MRREAGDTHGLQHTLNALRASHLCYDIAPCSVHIQPSATSESLSSDCIVTWVVKVLYQCLVRFVQLVRLHSLVSISSQVAVGPCMWHVREVITPSLSSCLRLVPLSIMKVCSALIKITITQI